MVQICALASGSNGNCYYVGNDNEAILVDIGISKRQLIRRMQSVDLPFNKVKAIFISHEHCDHVQGMAMLNKYHNEIGMYATKKTYRNIRSNYRSSDINFFDAGETITVGDIKIHSFAKQHDAKDPVSFRVQVGNVNVGVLTDLGTYNDEIQQHVNMCDAVFLESNYEHDLLMTGKYPDYLKRRVASEKGHLSNTQAYNLIDSLDSNKLKIILLSHISADNNSTALVTKSFEKLSDKYEIVITSRLAPTKVYEL